MRTYLSKLSPFSGAKQSVPLIFALLTALIAGGIFSFALAPYHQWWIAILSPALLYASLIKRTAKQGFFIGWLYGIGLWFVGAFWLYTSIHVYGQTSAWLSVLMIAIMASGYGFIYRRSMLAISTLLSRNASHLCTIMDYI